MLKVDPLKQIVEHRIRLDDEPTSIHLQPICPSVTTLHATAFDVGSNYGINRYVLGFDSWILLEIRHSEITLL